MLLCLLAIIKCSCMSKIEKVPRGIQSEKSSEGMASLRNLVSTIGMNIFELNCLPFSVFSLIFIITQMN